MKRSFKLWAAVFAIAAIGTVVIAGHIEHHGCEPCHTPHHSPTTADSGFPLWSGNATTNTFTLYSSDSMAATTEQPTGSSRLCLSCHDGTNGYIARIVDGHTVPSNLTTDISNSHPISFDYADTFAAKPTEYNDPALIPVGYLEAGRVECSSCHDIHDGEGVGEADLRGFEYVDGGDGGAMCQICHAKG